MNIFDTENIKGHERSYAMYQLLGKESSWIIRYGIWIMTVIISMLILLTFIIRYPDVVKSQFVLSSGNSPQRIVSNASGKLKLFVRNGDHVSSGAILGLLNNASNFEDVMKVKKDVLLLLKSINDKQTGVFKLNTSTYRLGELQVYYEDLIKSLESYKLISELDEKDTQIKYLNGQIAFLEKMRSKLKNQEDLSVTEYNYNKKKLRTDSLLYSKRVLSRSEYDKSTKDVIPFEKAISQARQNSFQNEITISQMRKDINDLNFNNKKEIQNTHVEILAKLNTLLSNIASWEDRSLFKANVTGEVSLSKIWQDGDNINSGEELMSIVPSIISTYGIATMPSSGVGKVHIGQKVLITLEGYQTSEYGFVVGVVSGISPIPNKGTYLIQVNLPKGLLTTYNKQIESKPELSGSADIVTTDLRLIDRIFSQIRIILLNK